MSGKLIKFVEEPSALICPVCKKVFSEPVISVKCGHTFCRKCVENNVRCPMDLLVCDSGQLVLNRAVMGQIEDLLIYCHNGLVSRDGGKSTEVDPSGCKRRIKLGSRDDHESKCEYSRVSCPVGGDLCGPLRQYQLEEHLLACTCVPCSFASFGKGRPS